jgi:hypothetical protein
MPLADTYKRKIKINGLFFKINQLRIKNYEFREDGFPIKLGMTFGFFSFKIQNPKFKIY